MPFAEIDVNFADGKNAALSDAAFRLHTAGILYCNRVLTDGRIPADEVPRLVRKYRKAAVTELVDGKWWIDNGDHFEVKDYLEHNPSRDDVLARKEKARKAARARWDQ